MDPGLNFLTCIGSVTFGIGKFSPKILNFSIFLFGSKKISLGQVKKYLGQRQGQPLINCGSEDVRVGSGQNYCGANSLMIPEIKYE